MAAWGGWVYQCLNCNYHYLPEYGPIRCPKCRSKERLEVSKINNPVELIESLLNSDEPLDMLGEFMGKPRCCMCKGVSEIGVGAGKVTQHYCHNCFVKIKN